MNSNPKVIVVIPTLGKNLGRLGRAIESIRQFTSHTNLELLIIDNSYEANLNLGESVDEVYSPGINLGWVGSLEFVRRNFDFDFLWSFQDDMTILNDALSVLVHALQQNEDLGVVSPIMLRNGVIPARTRGGKFIDKSKMQIAHIPETDVYPHDFIEEDDLCFVSSSGALWRKESLDLISGFDLNLYPVNHVDVDACVRMIEKGWSVKIETGAHIEHEITGSTETLLSSFLYQRNKHFLISKSIEIEAKEIYPVNNFDSDFLYELSRRSTYIFLELSKFATEKIQELQSANLKLTNELEKQKITKSKPNADLRKF